MSRNQLVTFYKKHKISVPFVKLIHVWYGSRSQLIGIIRRFDKNCYDLINVQNVKFVPDAKETPEQCKSDAYGSYNLFRPTSLSFHLINDGDYETDEFIEALIGYTTIDEISLPRGMGGGSASRLVGEHNRRIPIVILIDSESPDELGRLREIGDFIFSVPVANLIGP
jgi:hypothetical protein